ncbi:MAG: PHP domain-containing protein [Candidatus Nealsonbacteria bacterium]
MICDLHVHTYYSYDSTSLPEQIIERAIQKGVDCLAITDHNEIKGAIETARYALDKSILIIPGIEVKSREGDILGLNVKEVIPDRLSARETIKRIKKQGGVAIIPHPFATFYAFKGNLEDFLDDIDGIEVLNASISPSENKKALDFAIKNNLCFTAGSDAHFPDFIGRTYLEIPGENLSVEQVLEAIKNKNVKLGGKETSFFEKVIDHTKRNIAKLRMLKPRI